MIVRPLPIELESIDREWLTAALRMQAPDVTVKESSIVDLNRGTCTKVRLRLEMDEAGRRAGIPQSVILKGGFEPHSRNMWYMHESEVRAYRDLLPVVGLPSPVCYFADYDHERAQGIVIIEDLVARGVTFCSALKPQTHDEAARRLEVLARFHAQTWGSRDLDEGGRWHWASDMSERARVYFRDWLEADTWQRFVGSPRGAAASVHFHDRAWLSDALDRMAIYSHRQPHCVAHGDTHLGNLYIDRDGTPGFYDPQPHRAPGMLEVTYHLAGGLDIADRRRWEGSLVRHYLDALASHGVKPPAFDEAMHQFGIFLTLGYCIFMVNESFFQPEAINTAYTARFSAAMIDHDTMGLLKSIR
jgi:Ecdysteroid kinase-like family